MDITEIQERISNVAEILTAIFTKKNFDRAEEIAEYIKACVELTLKIAKDPIEKAGGSLPVSRGMLTHLLEEEFEKEMKKRSVIIPFSYEVK